MNIWDSPYSDIHALSIVPWIRIWDSPIYVNRSSWASDKVYAYGTVPYAYTVAAGYGIATRMDCPICVCMGLSNSPMHIYEHGQQQHEQELAINLYVKKYNMQNKIRSYVAS